MSAPSFSCFSALDSLQFKAEVEKFLTPGVNCFPRSLAAEILHRVAQSGEYGGVAEDITPFMIGVAIKRLVPNYEPDDAEAKWKDEFLEGMNFNPNRT